MQLRDQMNQSIHLDKPAKRIVSLVPSQTEFLYHLGLEEEVVGITKFCIHPKEWWKSKMRVGGTKNANFKRIEALKPDLIIGNKEENDQENILELKALAPVWMSDIKSLDDAFDMMMSLGEMTNKLDQAAQIVHQAKSNFKALKPISPKKKTLYFIWKDPWMLAGHDTFITEMMRICGFRNCAEGSRYPDFKIGDYPDTELILLSSEPYPFKEKDKKELQAAYPEATILLVDGEMFSWYGSRLVLAPAYFSNLIISIE